MYIYINTNRGRSILTYNIQYINVQKSTPIQLSKNNNSQIPIYYYQGRSVMKSPQTILIQNIQL